MSFLSYTESAERLAALDTGPVRTEKVPLPDALGRILAEHVVAEEDYPRHPTAAMDGYAIRAEDQAAGSIAVDTDDNPAGGENTVPVTPGRAVKTFTGAMMPEGADTLIPVENVTAENGRIRIDIPVEKGFSVRPVGESYFAGEILIPRGTPIGFAETGVMAELGRVMIPVAVRPRVGILATGSEILDLGEPAATPSQIRSSNNYTLAALARQSGAEAVQLGIAPDDREGITRAFENALETCDIVVSTGGVSVGDYDFVKDIIPSRGAEVVYKGVRSKPGQHIMVARRGRQFLVALPGFAYSSTVTFILYVVPLIRRMLGRPAEPEIVEAVLAEPFTKRSKKTEFTACNLRFEEGRYRVDFEDKKVGTSAILTNMLGPIGLMITDETDGSLEAGTTVRVLRPDTL
jgi:molybdopterin molybdotransferase